MKPRVCGCCYPGEWWVSYWDANRKEVRDKWFDSWTKAYGFAYVEASKLIGEAA